MNTIKFENKGNIKMIAHRGVSGLERENTCPAFVAAGVKSYYGIETDVHITKDGKVIVVHDDDLKRIAGLDMVVEESTFDELRAVKLKDTDNVTERADLFLPSLDEYINICKKYDKQAILELKNKMQPQEVWMIAEMVKQLGWFDRTTFISFAGENLTALREKFPMASAQYLTDKCTEEEIQFMINNRLDADLCGYCITPEKVQTLHQNGLIVNVWTLDTLEHANMAKDAGVDMITSNILE
jgi:glycerophosphoryl diester phosphodiesterase